MVKPKAVPLDHLRGKKKPVVRSIDIFVDDEANEAIREARSELAGRTALAEGKGAGLDAQVRRDEAEARLNQLLDEAAEAGHIVSFSFRAIGRKKFEKLKDEHTPTEDQQKEAREAGLAAGIRAELARLEYNPDTFPPALIAAASLEPKITEEEAWELFHVSEDWNDQEVTDLFLTALSAQQSRDIADLGKSRNGSRRTRS
jgi:hypothetical protein